MIVYVPEFEQEKKKSSSFQCFGNGFIEAMVKLYIVYVPEFSSAEKNNHHSFSVVEMVS